MSQAEFDSPLDTDSLLSSQVELNQEEQTEQAEQSQMNDYLDNQSPPMNSFFEQELSDCNAKCAQAHMLLQHQSEQLNLAQQVIQRQGDLTQSLQERISQLEQELELKSEQLIQSSSNCEDLRSRLKRQQHHTSQLKAALERCLESPTNISAKVEFTSAKFSGERESKIEPTFESISETVLEPIFARDVRDILREPVKPLMPDVLQNIVQVKSTEVQTVSEQAIDQTVRDFESATEHVEPKSQVETNLQLDSESRNISSKLNISPNVERVISDSLFFTPTETAETTKTPSEASVEAALGGIEFQDNFSQDGYQHGLLLPQVPAPQFIKALNTQISNQETAPLVGSQTAKRKVTSLAAVKLPQFPPLQRR
jgi:hypothetical protein